MPIKVDGYDDLPRFPRWPEGTRFAVGQKVPWNEGLANNAACIEHATFEAILRYGNEFGRPPRRTLLLIEIVGDQTGVQATVGERPI